LDSCRVRTISGSAIENWSFLAADVGSVVTMFTECFPDSTNTVFLQDAFNSGTAPLLKMSNSCEERKKDVKPDQMSCKNAVQGLLFSPSLSLSPRLSLSL